MKLARMEKVLLIELAFKELNNEHNGTWKRSEIEKILEERKGNVM